MYKHLLTIKTPVMSGDVRKAVETYSKTIQTAKIELFVRTTILTESSHTCHGNNYFEEIK